jgi:hypothetical protein
MVSWRRFGIGTISASGYYVGNLPMLTNKQQMIGKDTYLLLLKDMPQKTNSMQMKLLSSTGNSRGSQSFSKGNHAKVVSSLKRDRASCCAAVLL